MTRLGLAFGACLAALVLLGCGDDDDAASTGGKEDGGNAPTRPTPRPEKDAGDDGSGNTVTLGDAGMRLVDCEGEEDGLACGPNGGLLCLEGSCVPSRCGDGYVDPAREECDDENTAAGDGCDPDCAWDCT